MAKRKVTADVDQSVETTKAPTSVDWSSSGGMGVSGTAEYTVLARRYRPQQFGDLVGQEPVAQALGNALQSQRVAHAYLFTGARGVGKTSTARILAKALNCEKGPTITPCDQCEMCRAITSGEDVDVLEIDGASNRGIDEIRELRQNVQYRPSRGRYKIYIIDEVHMLTREAFNALLKTLEEPPPHVKFIFATTEVQKVPVTILSRCQRFDFAGIGVQRIVDRLRQIVASEKMQADDDALEFIARRAGGSMRDAQSLLDQLLAFGGERLTTAEVHHLLGTANEDRITALAGAVLAGNTTQALELLANTADQGLQLGELLDQLIDYWRDLMVVQCTGQDNQALSVTSKQRSLLKQQAGLLKPDTILAGLDILVTTKTRMRNTSHGRVLLEMALVRLSRLADLVSLSQLAQWLGREGQPPAAVARPTNPGATGSVPAAKADPEQEKKKEVASQDSPPVPDLVPLTQENLHQVWPQVIAEVGLALGSELRKAEVAISGPKNLVLRFPGGYNLLIDSTRQSRLEEVLRRLTGENWIFRFENSAAPAEQGATSNRTPETPVHRARRLRQEVTQLPLVKKAVDLLGAQIVSIDEEFGSTASVNSPADASENQESGEEEQD